MDAQVDTWFSTPIVHMTLPGAEAMNRELASLFLAREGEGDAWRSPTRISTQKGDLFESRFDLFAWPDAPVRELTRRIHSCLLQLVATVNHYDEIRMRELVVYYESWFHVTRKGGYQLAHFHPKHSWSGIYAVRPGDEVEGRPESGVVRFTDPRAGQFMHLDAGNEHLDRAFGNAPVVVRHRESQLVLFPSFLVHEVLPYEGESERIVVAFNANVRRRDERPTSEVALGA